MPAPRLSEDADRLLTAAREEARRDGDARFDGVHVLAVLAMGDAHAALLGERGIDRGELRLLVDAARVARSAPISYRDATARPVLDADLDRAIAERRPSWLSRFRPVGTNEILDVLAADPTCGSLLRRATSIVQSLQTVLQRVDRTNDESRPSVEHVLRLLVEERWFVFATRAAGGDIDRLREVLDESIAARETESSRDAAAAELSSLVHKTLAHAKAIGKRAMADLFVVRALQTERVASLFDHAGVRATKLLLVLVHGEVVVDDDALGVPPTEPCDVVIHDDDVTPMDLVVETLVACFDLPHEEATERMFAVHGNGLAVVATLPAEEARQRVAIARDFTRSRSSVLRISLRRVSGSRRDPPATMGP